MPSTGYPLQTTTTKVGGRVTADPFPRRPDGSVNEPFPHIGSFASSQPQPAGGGGGSTDVARAFDGNDSITISPGNLAGAPFDYGTFACVFTHINSASWQNIFHLANSGGTGESGVIEIAPYDQIWFGLTDINGTHGPVVGSSTNSFCLIITKGNGNVVGTWSMYDYNTSTWTNGNLDAAQPNGTANITGVVVGTYPGGNDWNTSRVSVVAAYRHWVPDHAARVAAGLHTDLDNWVTAASNADRAFVASLNQTSIGTAVEDLIGDGLETTTNQGTVSTGPAAFDNSLAGSGPIVYDELGLQVTMVSETTIPAEFVAVSELRDVTITSVTSAPTDSLVVTELASDVTIVSSTTASDVKAMFEPFFETWTVQTSAPVELLTMGELAKQVTIVSVSAAADQAVFKEPQHAITDAFSGANGTAWDPAKWHAAQGNLTGSTYDVQSGRGRVQTTTGGYAGITHRSKLEPCMDQHAIAKVETPANSEWYLGFWMRASNFTLGSNTQPADGYIIEPSLHYLRVDRVIGGSRSTVGFAVGGLNFWNATWWIRAEVVDDNIRVKTWLDGTAEPGWQINEVDPTPVTTPGEVGTYHYSGAAVETVTSYWDEFAATNLDTAPVTVTSVTSAATQQAVLNDPTALTVVSSTTESDVAAFNEPVTLNMQTTFTVPVDQAVLNDVLTQVATTATTLAIDQVIMTDATQVTVASTTSASDARAITEDTALTVTSVVSDTDSQVYTEPTSITAVVSTTVTDLKVMTDHLGDTWIVTTSVVDVQGGTDEENTSLVIVSVVSCTDQMVANELQRTVVASSVTEASDLRVMFEPVSATIVSSATATDSRTFTEDLSVLVGSSILSADQLSMVESTLVAIQAEISTNTQAVYGDALEVVVEALVTVQDSLTAATLGSAVMEFHSGKLVTTLTGQSSAVGSFEGNPGSGLADPS